MSFTKVTNMSKVEQFLQEALTRFILDDNPIYDVVEIPINELEVSVVYAGEVPSTALYDSVHFRKIQLEAGITHYFPTSLYSQMTYVDSESVNRIIQGLKEEVLNHVKKTMEYPYKVGMFYVSTIEKEKTDDMDAYILIRIILPVTTWQREIDFAATS